MSCIIDCFTNLFCPSNTANSVTKALPYIPEEEEKKKDNTPSTSKKEDVISRTGVAIASIRGLNNLAVPPNNLAVPSANAASTARSTAGSNARTSSKNESPPTASPSFVQRNLIGALPQSPVVEPPPQLPPAVALKPVRTPKSRSSTPEEMHGRHFIASTADRRKTAEAAQFRIFTVSKSVANIDERVFFLHQEAMQNAPFNGLLSSLNSEKFNKIEGAAIVFNSAFILLAASSSVSTFTGVEAVDAVGGYTYSVLPPGSFKSNDPNIKFTSEIEYLKHHLKSSDNNSFITTANIVNKFNSISRIGKSINRTASEIDLKDRKVQVLIASHQEYYIAIFRKIVGISANTFEPDIPVLQEALKKSGESRENKNVEHFENIFYSRYDYHFGHNKNAFQLAILKMRQHVATGDNVKGFIIDSETYAVLAMSGDELQPEDVLWKQITLFLTDIEESLKSAKEESSLPGLGSPHCNTRKLLFKKPGNQTAATPVSSLQVSQSQLGSIFYDIPFSVIILDDFRPNSSSRGSFSSVSRKIPLLPFNTAKADLAPAINRSSSSTTLGGPQPTPNSSQSPTNIESNPGNPNTHLSPPSKIGQTVSQPLMGSLSPPTDVIKATPRRHGPLSRRVKSPRDLSVSPPQRGINEIHVSRGTAPTETQRLERIDEPPAPPHRSTAPPSIAIKYNESDGKAVSGAPPA